MNQILTKDAIKKFHKYFNLDTFETFYFHEKEMLFIYIYLFCYQRDICSKISRYIINFKNLFEQRSI